MAPDIKLKDVNLGKIIAGFGHSWRFVRYGDFELFAMQGMKLSRNRPSRGKVYATPQVAVDLWSTFVPVRSKPYYYALQPLTIRQNIVPYYLATAVNWANADVFHKANMKGQLFPLVQQLKLRKVGLVGPEHLGELKFLTTGGHVKIPFGAADLERDRILDETFRLVTSGVDVVAFSASYLANLAIHQFSPSTHAAMIDFGSIWEPYVNIKNRGYHKKLSEDTLRRNMEGK